MYDIQKVRERMIENVRTICKERGLSNNQLAKLSGVSGSTISDLMNEKTIPDFYTVLSLCKALNITMCELLGLKGECFYIGKEEQHTLIDQKEIQLKDNWKRLSDDYKKLVLLYIEMILNYQNEENKKINRSGACIPYLCICNSGLFVAS